MCGESGNDAAGFPAPTGRLAVKPAAAKVAPSSRFPVLAGGLRPLPLQLIMLVTFREWIESLCLGLK